MDAKTAPSFFLEYGKMDNVVPYLQSVDLADSLKKAIGENKVKLKLFDNCGHDGADFYTEENLKKVITFLDSVLK